MPETKQTHSSRFAFLRPSPYVLLPLGIAALGLLAAPLYGNVMEGVMWMGQTVRALCGF
jgi:hypothetical protein